MRVPGAQREHGMSFTKVSLSLSSDDLAYLQVLLPAPGTGLSRDSKAQAEQVRVISVRRISAVAGWVPAELMGALDDALRLHLAL